MKKKTKLLYGEISMIYWFIELPPKPFDDNIKIWKLVIPYKWLRECFMAVVYLLQFVLVIVLMTYIRNYTPKYDYDINSQSVILIYKIFSYISNHRSIIYITIITMPVIHELLHIAVIFNKGDFSITFKHFFFWITSNAEMSKFRYFTFTFLPLFILAGIPFILSFFAFNTLAFIFRVIALYNLIISTASVLVFSNSSTVKYSEAYNNSNQ